MYWHVFEWAKEVLFDPKKNTKKDMKYGDFIKKLSVLSLVSGVLTTIIGIGAFGVLSKLGLMGTFPFGAIAAIPLFIVAAIVQPFVSAALFHFFGKIVFRLMKGNYKKTYNAVAYSMVPTMLLSWIPAIGGIISAIWSVIIGVYALSNQHKISTGRAILVVLIPLIIVVVLALIAAAIIGAFIAGAVIGPAILNSVTTTPPY